MDHTSVPPFLFLGHVLLAFPHIYLRVLRVFYATPLSLLVILMWVFLIFYSLFLVCLIDILHYYLAISVFLVALLSPFLLVTSMVLTPIHLFSPGLPLTSGLCCRPPKLESFQNFQRWMISPKNCRNLAAASWINGTVLYWCCKDIA